MKMIGNGLRLIRVFFRLVFEMIRNYKKLNNDPDHNFLICKEICQKIVESAKIQLEIVQKEALPKLENFLLVSNHRCFFDVVFLLAAIEDTISFVAAKELWHYPILSRYLDSIGCVALERGAKKMETIKNNIVSMHQALAKGNLVLFPEGECSYYDEQMHKFRKGGFIGLDAKQPIVPVYIKPERLSSIGRWIVPHRPRLKKEPRQPPKLQIWQETKFLHSDKCQKVDILLQKNYNCAIEDTFRRLVA